MGYPPRAIRGLLTYRGSALIKSRRQFTGRLAYYQVLLGGVAGSGLFNYQKWIREYLNNRRTLF